MNLVIVESPTKARTLSRFLGQDYAVEATMGHIKDLPKSKLGVDIDHDFAPDYEIVPKREQTVQELRSRSKKAKTIFLATDPDREGEAIASHVRDELANSKLKRIVFHEITKEAVEEAILHPKEIDKHLVEAQTARRVLDRLVGYKLSPLLWRKVRRGLSAGRVQTVTVRLIVEKEREIEAFKPQEYWEIFCKLKTQNSKLKSEFTVQLIEQEVKNKKQADKIVADLKKASYTVVDVKKREIIKNPYPPFTTSTLSQAASRIFGWSAKKTMSIAQRLYEEGLITYHRTDSLNIAQTAVEKARNYIKKEYGERYLPAKARFYKTSSKVAQEAHEAIRPTDIGQLTINNLQFAKGVKELGLLYSLIWRRFVACQMAASIYDETTIDVEARSARQMAYLLRASGQVMKFDGWRKLFRTVEEGIVLPEVEIGEEPQLVKVEPFQKFTQPPPRFTEASLIKTLEKLGIGRPSTYAPTISTIQIRNYVEKEEGKFTPTNVGVAVNDFLIEYFPDVFDYAFTAEMEGDLDKIANGEVDWVKPVKLFWTPFSRKLRETTQKSKRVKIATEKVGRDCPVCKKGELVIRLGRFGKFISCSRFPDCKYTEKYIEKTGAKCPDCSRGDVVIKKSGKGRRFFGCSRYPDCRWASWRSPQKSS